MTAPPQDLSASKYRWIVLALIIGLAVFRLWQQPDAANRPSVPVKVAENEPLKDPKNSVSESDSSAKPDSDSEEASEVAPLKNNVARRGDTTVKEASPKASPNSKSKQSSPTNKTGPPHVDGLKVENIVVKDRDGEVVFRGTVDLTKTLTRIDENRTLSEYRNDGVEFKNFERRLPNKPRGYYREWVHPTPGQRGPGAQRIVTGKAGEAFYTWDHYENFVRIRSGK